MFPIYKQLDSQRVPATHLYALKILSTQHSSFALPQFQHKKKIHGGSVQANFEDKDRYKDHKHERQTLEVGEKTL